VLIATFGANTAWVGTRLTWVDGRFVVEGQGPVTPETVMDYDRQGHLIWVNEGARAWVGSRAARGTRAAAGVAAGGDEPRMLAGPAGSKSDGLPRTEARTVLLKRIVLLVIGILLVVNLALVVMLVGGLRLP